MSDAASPARTARPRDLGPVLAALAAVAAAWLAFNLLVWGFGESPAAMLAALVRGTWGTAYGVGQVLFKATPLLFAGVAVDVALRAGLFNIGAEGQIAIASLAVGVAGSRMPAGTPAVIAVPALVLLAMVAGGAWAAVPAVLRARLGAHEVISTIMMNRIAAAAVGLVLGMGAAVKGTVRTPDVAPGAHLPRLEVFVGALRGSAASLAAPIAALVAVVAVLAFKRLRAAREAALVGMNPVACAAEHIPVARRLTQALVASGAIAGLASLGTVLGYKGYFEEGLGAGAGFGGIAVALLGQRSAVGLVLAALLFGTLQQGGLAINAHVPMELMDVLQAVVVVAVGISLAARRGGR